jgi:hypothetical protein
LWLTNWFRLPPENTDIPANPAKTEYSVVFVDFLRYSCFPVVFLTLFVICIAPPPEGARRSLPPKQALGGTSTPQSDITSRDAPFACAAIQGQTHALPRRVLFSFLQYLLMAT